LELYFPFKGIHKGFLFEKQVPGTTSAINNMRPWDSIGGRIRGGQRPALDKWGAGTQIGSVEQPVVSMCVVSSVV
jgi:hypothetical protein